MIYLANLYRYSCLFMKRTVTFLFFYCIASGANAQTATDNAAADSTLTLTETSYDFGKIPQGKPVSHVFDVIDKGTDSLKITYVQASCGCTTPEWDRGRGEAPGERTEIKVGYNAGPTGSFRKTGTIIYKGEKKKVTTIRGKGWKPPATSAPVNTGIEDL